MDNVIRDLRWTSRADAGAGSCGAGVRTVDHVLGVDRAGGAGSAGECSTLIVVLDVPSMEIIIADCPIAASLITRGKPDAARARAGAVQTLHLKIVEDSVRSISNGGK